MVIQPRDEAEARIWKTALEVSDLFADVPWVLVGAQMVILLEREAGRPTTRTTGDTDAIVDVRALSGGTRTAAERLVGSGYHRESADHPYRFVRGDAQVDLLAPDNLGGRTDLTTIPPARTIQIPGGSRALATRRIVEVDVIGDGSGVLPIPTLAGAIVLKMRAWQSRGARRDVEDLARLLSLVVDVEVVRGELKTSERRRLAEIAPLADPDDSVWRALPDPSDARAALARLAS